MTKFSRKGASSASSPLRHAVLKAFLTDRLLAGDRDLPALRADRWAQAHPHAIRPHRIEEARFRADEKAARRARRRLPHADEK